VRPAPTLGGLESLACLPDDDRAGGGLRLSVGVEDPADIAADLDRALACTAARTPSATAAAR
jgi:cystathionine beta-lyase/cystathionine gamma-synthase